MEEFILDAEPTGLADGLSMGHEGKHGIKNNTQAVKISKWGRWF